MVNSQVFGDVATGFGNVEVSFILEKIKPQLQPETRGKRLEHRRREISNCVTYSQGKIKKL